MSHRAVIAALALFCAAASPAFAYKVAPLIHYLTPTGTGATTAITIDNPHDFPLTLEVTAERRVFENGVPAGDTPADGDFLIFPPQAIVAPGKRQKVQIRYVGEETDAASFYRVRVAQLPIDFTEGGEGASVSLSYHFLAAVYVAPSGAKPKLETVSVAPSDDGWQLTVRNAGDAHATLTNYALDVEAESGAGLQPATAIDTTTAPVLEPGGTATYTLRADGVAGVTAVSFEEV